MKESLEILKSETCACGKPKPPRNAFCPRCYFSLPRDLKQEIYRKLGNGFENAYKNAKKFLICEIWKTAEKI